jgi:hypothetical protein
MPSLSTEEMIGLLDCFVFYTRLPKTLWADIKIFEKNTEEGQAKRRELFSLYHSE